jgi:hypothetical protein
MDKSLDSAALKRVQEEITKVRAIRLAIDEIGRKADSK